MRKYLKFIILFLIAGLILWLFGRNLDWEAVSQSLQKANKIYLFSASLIVCIGYLLRAKRWQVLLEPIAKTSLKELFAATTVGFSVIVIIGRAGELARPMWLSMRDKRVRPSAGIVTLVVERIFDLASLICFFSVNLLWLKPPVGRESEFEYVTLVGILMLIGVVCGMFTLYLYQRFSEPIIDWFESKKILNNKVGKIFLSILRQLATALEILKSAKEVAIVIFWTMMLWFAIAFPTWLVILAFGLPMDFTHSLFVMGWAAIGSVVPTPGGAAGAFHAATAGGLIFLGVDKDQAFAVAIAMHFIYFAPALAFGFYYFLSGDISMARLKSLLSSNHPVEDLESENPNVENEEKIDFGHQSKIQNPESKIV